MGARKMGSKGDGGGTQERKTHALGRQGTLYSLTLDEVQRQLGDLGKPFTSMNLDELLKNVWSAEVNQGIGRVDFGATEHNQLDSAPLLHCPSSLNLARDLTHKTVDEVWHDIQQGQKKKNIDGKAQKRQPLLGEMTLEDFLVKAGVVAESFAGRKRYGSILRVDQVAVPYENISQQPQWMHYQLPTIHHPSQQQQSMVAVFMLGDQVQQPVPAGANPIRDATCSETQMNMSASPLIDTMSDTQTSRRKRVAPGDLIGKTVERRQKRMIKNRESAARSRARKQAYTHELENKVSHLEEENERLRRQKESGKVLPCVPPPAPKYQLRRASSAPL